MPKKLAGGKPKKRANTPIKKEDDNVEDFMTEEPDVDELDEPEDLDEGDTDEEEEEEQTSDEEPGEELDEPEGEDDDPDTELPAKKCIYKNAAPDDNDEDEEAEFEDFFDNDKLEEQEVEPSQRKSKPFITKYEIVRLISDRAKSLSLAAKPMIKDVEGLSSKDIAKKELEFAIQNKQRIFPLKIKRKMPDGKIEIWYVDELERL